MDAITLLKNDHRAVEKLFKAIQDGNANREQLFKELKNSLDVHTDIEEKLFYPAVRDAQPTHEKVVESIEEHKQVKIVLADLEKADKTTEHWLAGVKVLSEDVQHHIGEEEDDLFPKVKDKVLSKEQLEDLGTRMEAMKMQEMAALKSR
ncbi:MAG TPA: hemerythrin domain-containing protein [Candidatus Dormibacteraeota bacterium]